MADKINNDDLVEVEVDTEAQTEPETAPKGDALPPVAGKAKSPKAARKVGVPVLVVAAVVACVLGVLIGKFLLGGASGLVSGKTSLSEGELDAAVASYTYRGGSNTITARDVLSQTTGLDAAKQDDGTYAVPSADAVLSFARTAILNNEVQAQGIQVSDEDMAAYAKDTLGTDDYAELANTYGMSEDEVKTIVRDSAGTKQLYDKVVGETDAVAEPTAPTAPAEGSEDTPTAEYGKYIVDLLGDEWDSATNTWARQDGPYYAALKDQTFSADSATYQQAMTAYYVAYQQYPQQASTGQAKWTEFVNGLLANASITVGELVS